MSRLAAVGAASLALLASPARAQVPVAPYDGTARRHLGLALRLDAGVGYLASSASALDTSIRGGGGSLGVMVGGAVSENLIAGAEFWNAVAFSPTFTRGGTSVSGVDASLALVGIGVNLTYYLVPANVYLSVSPSVATLRLTASGVTGGTRNGFAMKIAVGKEWWVADHWGIGVAGHFCFAGNADKGASSPTWSSAAGGIAFSATYN